MKFQGIDLSKVREIRGEVGELTVLFVMQDGTIEHRTGYPGEDTFRKAVALWGADR